jgi:hypothetical protein
VYGMGVYGADFYVHFVCDFSPGGKMVDLRC